MNMKKKIYSRPVIEVIEPVEEEELLAGSDVTSSVTSPAMAAERVASVEQTSWLQPSFSRKQAASAQMVTASAPGTALVSTVRRKLPRTRSRLGSRARKNDGAPMVSPEISVSWMGWKG